MNWGKINREAIKQSLEIEIRLYTLNELNIFKQLIGFYNCLLVNLDVYESPPIS